MAWLTRAGMSDVRTQRWEFVAHWLADGNERPMCQQKHLTRDRMMAAPDDMRRCQVCGLNARVNLGPVRLPVGPVLAPEAAQPRPRAPAPVVGLLAQGMVREDSVVCQRPHRFGFHITVQPHEKEM